MARNSSRHRSRSREDRRENDDRRDDRRDDRQDDRRDDKRDDKRDVKRDDKRDDRRDHAGERREEGDRRPHGERREVGDRRPHDRREEVDRRGHGERREHDDSQLERNQSRRSRARSIPRHAERSIREVERHDDRRKSPPRQERQERHGRSDDYHRHPVAVAERSSPVPVPREREREEIPREREREVLVSRKESRRHQEEKYRQREEVERGREAYRSRSVERVVKVRVSPDTHLTSTRAPRTRSISMEKVKRYPKYEEVRRVYNEFSDSESMVVVRKVRPEARLQRQRLIYLDSMRERIKAKIKGKRKKRFRVVEAGNEGKTVRMVRKEGKTFRLVRQRKMSVVRDKPLRVVDRTLLLRDQDDEDVEIVRRVRDGRRIRVEKTLEDGRIRVERHVGEKRVCVERDDERGRVERADERRVNEGRIRVIRDPHGERLQEEEEEEENPRVERVERRVHDARAIRGERQKEDRRAIFGERQEEPRGLREERQEDGRGRERQDDTRVRRRDKNEETRVRLGEEGKDAEHHEHEDDEQAAEVYCRQQDEGRRQDKVRERIGEDDEGIRVEEEEMRSEEERQTRGKYVHEKRRVEERDRRGEEERERHVDDERERQDDEEVERQEDQRLEREERPDRTRYGYAQKYPEKYVERQGIYERVEQERPRRVVYEEVRRKLRTGEEREKERKNCPAFRQALDEADVEKSHAEPSKEYDEGENESDAHADSQERSVSKATNATKDDEIIHFDWYAGQMLHNRYRITHLFGDGTFGRVLAAQDVYEDGAEVAIKVIRDVPRYQENAKIEAQILKDIRKNDLRNESRCIRLYETFTHRHRFYCITTEPLGESLYEFLKNNLFRGFHLEDIQDFAYQSLCALAFLHKMRITHTDLKPENILLQYSSAYEARFPYGKSDGKPYLRPERTDIKLIDFGNATYDNDNHSAIINTRQYRSPEVILNNGWDEAADLWCLGAILLELYTGELFFTTHDDAEHLALMEQLLEPFANNSEVVDRSPSSTRNKFFVWDWDHSVWRLNFHQAASDKSRAHVKSQRRAIDLMKSPQHSIFANFCEELMTIDNARRPTATQTLQKLALWGGMGDGLHNDRLPTTKDAPSFLPSHR